MFALLLGFQARDDRAGPWPDLYARLARLEGLQKNSSEFNAEYDAIKATAERRERSGLKAKNNIEKFRARTVLFHLQRLRNLPGELATEPDAVLEWLPFEAWYATRALRPGLYRVETAVAALDDTQKFDPERAAWAVKLFEEERAKFDFDLSERLAVGLYRRDPSVENVERLARVHVARGNGAAASRVLGEALSATEDPLLQHKLYTARARAASANLDERASLSDYGAALALGSREAALDLADLALAAGEREKARFLADAVLRDAPLDPEAATLRALSRLPPRVPRGSR